LRWKQVGRRAKRDEGLVGRGGGRGRVSRTYAWRVIYIVVNIIVINFSVV
jgi:hypothetical protein